MSRQSKAARKAVIARQITAAHLAGDKGPQETTPKHGKRNRAQRGSPWWQKDLSK